ncbi:MAG: ubiquinone/menaquinone biosynthesis methyltransferase [Verrucomicrobiales bacterium]
MGATPWRFESSREHFLDPRGTGARRAKPTAIVERSATTRDQDPEFVRQAFSAIAERYALTNHVLSLGIDVLWRRRVARMVAASDPRRVLDLATGSGDLAAAVARTCGEQCEVTGVDFCLPMLAVARARGIFPLLAADGTRLPFADDTFDALTIGFGLRNMESWERAVAEMARVLRPGGLLVILDFSLPRAPWLRASYRFYLHRVLPKIAGALTGNTAAYRYLGESIERFPAGDVMGDLLRSGGFAGIEACALCGGIASTYRAEKA